LTRDHIILKHPYYPVIFPYVFCVQKQKLKSKRQHGGVQNLF